MVDHAWVHRLADAQLGNRKRDDDDGQLNAEAFQSLRETLSEMLDIYNARARDLMSLLPIYDSAGRVRQDGFSVAKGGMQVRVMFESAGQGRFLVVSVLSADLFVVQEQPFFRYKPMRDCVGHLCWKKHSGEELATEQIVREVFLLLMSR